MDDHAISPSIELQTTAGVHIDLPIVGLGGRSYAFVIDWHIRLLLAFGWWLAAMIIAAGGFDFSNVDVSDSPFENVALFLIFVIPVLIYLFYHPVLEIVMNGRTPGKRLAGLRIVGKHGEPAGAGALLTRNVFRLIDSMPFFYVIGIFSVLMTRDGVRIGDLAAGTVLVYEEKLDRRRVIPLLTEGAADAKARELIADLLDRWRELDETTRIRLSDALLARHGIAPSQMGRTGAKSRERHGLLEQLLRSEA